ncbi:MAG: peptidoglycan DD-metalloendopeptidase family protein [Thermomicrobiales bacterium]|nr:peptidoglycan DD-metalloendopeptidase family protein [Thermomicrobiales bacterium]
MSWQHERLRRLGASLLAASLVLSACPASSLISLAAPFSLSEDLDVVAVDHPDGVANDEQPTTSPGQDSASSVRQRGQEAPVDLRQIAADEEVVTADVGADPGDGPPRKNQLSAREEQATRHARNANIRLWPLPADSYTFTQPFGCVPQIAHFYQPGSGCPADRPVIHTGLDLAAPEGTPFYAAASGWVTQSGYDREVGVANTRIIIQHEGRNDGYATEYLHWIASFVDVGDHVEAGQLIGEVGSVGYSTGPHLHFSLIDLDTGEHIDPTRWLPREPGTEGYRGITPRRAAMRLPAGTTAGVPEHTDPSPPDAPTREDLPESAAAATDRQGKKGNKRKKAKAREERRARNGHNRQKDTDTITGKDGTTSEDGSATSGDKQAEREKSRTRKRKRNRNGSAESKNVSGEDASGNSRKERRKTDSGGKHSSAKNDKRASRKDKANDPVEQTDARNRGNDKNSSGGGNKNKKNRERDKTQQVAEETPAPVEEAPAGSQEPQPGDSAERGDQAGATGSDGENDGNATNGESGSPDEAVNDEHGARDKGKRNGNAGKNGASGGDSPAEVGA